MIIMKSKGSATVEDLLKTPKDGQKYELVDGEIVVSPTGWRHGKVALKISHIIATFLENNPIGEVCGTDVGFKLPNDNLRSPDVVFVRKEKLPDGEAPVGFGEFVPDLCVEVLSPSDSMRHVAQKIGEFLDCGVPLVWLVDPERKSVTVYRSLSRIEQYESDDVITAEPIIPGFSCPVSRFFS
jgi:Uma2 family endonuclease